VAASEPEPLPNDLEVEDPRAIRALAHPLRISMISLLRERGAMTATQLAGLVGESSGTTSYHLRELARHGLIEEVSSRGSARERYWKARARHFHFGTPAHATREGLEAMAQLRARIVEAFGESMMRYLEQAPRLEPEWQEASLTLKETLVLTADELIELDEKLLELVAPYRTDRRRRAPRGATRVTLLTLGFPDE
jgi:DNA-binding transcriptional ArsR family regulator